MGRLVPKLKHALWATTSLADEASRHADFKLADVSFLPPVPDPEKILCVGLNYISHIKEGGREPPPKPIIFTRYPNSQVGHGQAMVRPMPPRLSTTRANWRSSSAAPADM